MPNRGVNIQIDRQALIHNFLIAKRTAPKSKTLAVIKADAYGHGAVECAKTLEKYADGYAVVFLDEARQLRNAGISLPILLLQGAQSSSDLVEILTLNLWTVVHSQQQVKMLEETHLKSPLHVWLKINTGMSRLGFSDNKIAGAYSRLKACNSVSPNINLMTHLACADDKNNGFTEQQLACFKQLTKNLPGSKSIANSAGVLGWPETHADWNRVGIMLYGASPFVDISASEIGLIPVMTVSSSLIAIQDCRKGQSLGYGASWTCPELMPVGVVAIGYGDGYSRNLTAGKVLINNQKCRVIGRISMDSIMVDLRGCPAKVGDTVILWGKELPVEEVATAADTISYELLCQINGQVNYT